ncbi:MAG: hypothetical protein L0Y66_12225 [Myxococcaceae bacterium]|nr:hypothetical protein [Myxococcaceae bacterium]MCI0669212.1 hypothetical protein [Myxococcaceae bacterium]
MRSSPAAALLLLVTPLAALADGFVFRLEPGVALWALDAEHIQAQTSLPAGDVQTLFVEHTPSAAALTLQVGYNIREHVTLSAGLTATGWDLLSEARGGAGLLAAEVAWHPAALFPVGQLGAGRHLDGALFFGAGYGVVGEKRAMDGLALQMGLRAEYVPTPGFSLGLSLRLAPLHFSRYVTHWNSNTSVPLPKSSGGVLFVPALTFAFRLPVAG